MKLELRRSCVRGAAAVGLVLLTAWPVLGQKSDPFYASLLEDGVHAYQRGEHLRAGEDLRIASFGLLESPTELARALTYLALAQSATGDSDAFRRTYSRLRDLESGFEAYSAATLAADTRASLDAAAQTLLGVSDLGSPAPPEAPAAATAASAPRAELCISWEGSDDCRRVVAATEPPAEPEEPAAEAAPGPVEFAALERLDRLASDRTSNRELRSAFTEASGLADRYPDWPEMQRVAAVLAARTGSFADAVRYYDRGGERTENGPLQLFYLSVALFETDQPDAAATVLRRALPTLEQNREIRKYVRRILSEESAG